MSDVENVLLQFYEADTPMTTAEIANGIQAILRFMLGDDLKEPFRPESVDQLLHTADVSRVHPTMLVAIVRSTFPVRTKLRFWKDFRDRAAQRLDNLGRDSKRILRGLY